MASTSSWPTVRLLKKPRAPAARAARAAAVLGCGKHDHSRVGGLSNYSVEKAGGMACTGVEAEHENIDRPITQQNEGDRRSGGVCHDLELFAFP